MDSFLVAHPLSHPLNLGYWGRPPPVQPSSGRWDMDNQIPGLSNPSSQTHKPNMSVTNIRKRKQGETPAWAVDSGTLV